MIPNDFPDRKGKFTLFLRPTSVRKVFLTINAWHLESCVCATITAGLWE
jgi:hypothetical protein